MINIDKLNIQAAPLITDSYLVIIVITLVFSLLFFAYFKPRAIVYRGLAFICAIVALLNLSWLSMEKTAMPGILTIISDESYSNVIGQRGEQTKQVLNVLKEKLSQDNILESKIITGPDPVQKNYETNLFDIIDNEIKDIPPKQRAGLVIVSDGNIHDIPNIQTSRKFDKYGPVHFIKTGKANEYDRQIEIIKSPLYGLQDSRATIEFIVHDNKAAKGSAVSVSYNLPGDEPAYLTARVGHIERITVPIKHAGHNPIEIIVENGKDEISYANNRRAVIIQGIRDKLRVLLVSGAPYEGGRHWRSLLTSDPAIEIIHFTILRDVDSRDRTPRSEMALIPFPHQQLFHKQLDSFDLIIFDRYRNQGILQRRAYKNIIRYLNDGGALLFSSGPEYLAKTSLYRTDLGQILIGKPGDNTYNESFTPSITAQGQTHPLTHNLGNGLYNDESWAPWLRQIEVKTDNGDKTLLSGHKGAPLLLIGERGEGRIAHLTSDQIWLWARGYQQGGPYIDLLRKTIHWLLKEPSLEEGLIDLKIKNNDIHIKRYIASDDTPLTMTAPDGSTENIILRKTSDGEYVGQVSASQQGLYSFLSGNNRGYIINGAYDSPEQTNILRDEKSLLPLIKSSGGGIYEANNIADVTFKTISANSNRYYARNTIGLRQSEQYEVSKVNYNELLPIWGYLALFVVFSLLGWRRESQ